MSLFRQRTQIDMTQGLEQANPLPAWSDGAAKSTIVDFVDRVTRHGSPEYVVPEERIATFDNDGTLCAEQPVYFQLAFTFDRIKDLAPLYPEWKETQPFKSVLEGDSKTLAACGEKDLLHIVAVTHANMSTQEFTKTVEAWTRTARHPRFKRPYTELVYQPMLELLSYLRVNGFKTLIVSGGRVEFIAPWVNRVYGIPPEQVVSSGAVGKPVGTNRLIGRRPIFAFGNSDGDQEMLEWISAGDGPRFMGLLHHTDAEREWAYDRASRIGKLDKALDEAIARAWTVVDMKRDWRSVFPPP